MNSAETERPRSLPHVLVALLAFLAAREAFPQRLPVRRQDAAVIAPATLVSTATVEPWLYAIDDGRDDESSTLFRLGISPAGGSVGLSPVGETGVANVYDIAFMGSRLIGVGPGASFGLTDDVIIDIDPDTGSATGIGHMKADGNFNALEAESESTLIAATTSGEVWRIDLAAFQATRLGTFGSGLESSGDLALATDGVLFGMVRGIDSDSLARIDRGTGRATTLGKIGHTQAWGLAIHPFTSAMLAVIDAEDDPKLVSVNRATGVVTAIGRVPAPAGLSGLAVRPSAPPLTGLDISRINVGNSSVTADAIDIWLDVRKDGQPIANAGSYQLFLLNSSGSLVDSSPVDVDALGTRWHARLPLPPAANSRAFGIQNGRVAIAPAAAAVADAYVIGDLAINVLGTGFDMATHAYAFANSEWGGSPSGAFLWWDSDDYFKAGDTIQQYLPSTTQDVFWKSVAVAPILEVLGVRANGLCYGMANSAIANFTLTRYPYWGDVASTGSPCSTTSFCDWTDASQNSWKRGIDARPGSSSPVRPFNGDRIFDDTIRNQKWTVEAAKKVMFHFVTQSWFGGNGNWAGSDTSTPIVNRASGRIDNDLLTLLQTGNPVSITVGFDKTRDGDANDKKDAWHAVVATQMIQWTASGTEIVRLMIYDNNWPLKSSHFGESASPFAQITIPLSPNAPQSVSMDRTRLNGSVFEQSTAIPVNALQFMSGCDDAQGIYDFPRAPCPEKLVEPGFGLAADDVQSAADAEADNYIRVSVIGAESVEVTDVATGARVHFESNIDRLADAKPVLLQTGILTQLFIPGTSSRYRVNLRKVSALSRLKIFIAQRRNNVAEKITYDNVQVSANDRTRVEFFVGSGNLDVRLKRTSDANAVDTVQPTFQGPAPSNGARRRSVRH